MDKLAKILQYVEEKLNNINSLVLLNMRNSDLTESDIRNFFKNIDLVPNKELITFYMWKNGYKDIIPLDHRSIFIPHGVFFELNSMLELYNIMQQNDFAKRFFFPISHDQPYLINLNRKSKYFGYVYFYSPSLLILKPIRVFDSLAHMFETVISCFNEKALSYDEERYLNVKWDLYKKICKSCNPNSE